MIVARSGYGNSSGELRSGTLRIALLEDDEAQAELMQNWLKDAQHDCHHFATGQKFLQALQRESFDLAILDWGLPDIPGDQVLSSLRDKHGGQIPVLFITSRGQEEDIVHALQHGADDYMSKPVKRAETLARIAALGRRSQPFNDEQPLEFEPFIVDPSTNTLSKDGTAIELTQKEFELAYFLFRNVGRLVSRGHILESVWGTKPDLNTRTVDTHVSRLRSKLGLTPQTGWRLGAVYQHGYRLERIQT